MPYLENKKARVVLYHLPKTGGRFSFIGQERNEDGRNPY